MAISGRQSIKTKKYSWKPSTQKQCCCEFIIDVLAVQFSTFVKFDVNLGNVNKVSNRSRGMPDYLSDPPWSTVSLQNVVSSAAV